MCPVALLAESTCYLSRLRSSIDSRKNWLARPSNNTQSTTINCGFSTKFSKSARKHYLTWFWFSHEINQFCSKHTLQEVFIDKFDALDEMLAEALSQGAAKWAPGIEIIAIRVTKPKIPDNLMKNYE